MPSIHACFDYKDPIIKKAIWDLKYHYKTHIADILGKLLYEEFIEEISALKLLSEGSPLYVIPVPLSWTRRKVRGYNQAEKIAQGFCSQEEGAVLKLKTDIVLKKINTPQQAKILNKSKRLRNIKGVFSIKNADDVKGMTCIIIDDVTTTGGTLTEIMQTLKRGGAKTVVSFAVAH